MIVLFYGKVEITYFFLVQYIYIYIYIIIYIAAIEGLNLYQVYTQRVGREEGGGGE